MIERLDAYMARANAAYYADHDPFANFTTAPEITQVFGELLGMWTATTWQAMGAPSPVILAEAGPGRGTLMADALRAVARITPGFAAALRLHLIENSPALRTIQAAKLDATWHDSAETLPDGPLLLIANEFLDALPIRQFIRRGAVWSERHVADGAYVECPADFEAEAAEGAVIERGEAAVALVAGLARRVAATGGACLFVDYGPERSAPGESLQALRHGRPADPLAVPGQADITAHVDFAALAMAATEAGAAVHGPLPQGVFLTRLGLFQRSFNLARNLAPARGATLIDAARRLAEPDRMGRLFKALAVCHPDLPVPSGFAA